MSDNNDENEDFLDDLSVKDVNPSHVPTIMTLNDGKAGMSGLDTNRINQIIFEWTKGSNFHSFQTKRQTRIDDQINEMKKRLDVMNEWQRRQCLKETDISAKTIESNRVLNKIIVHLDLDMFFAAVEVKHRPELADKPIAVGSDQMLATSNYIARKYGIRPAMPGALAKRLCPQLIIIKHSFGSYSDESKEVMKIISEFDPKFVCMGLDETYMDLTEYVIDRYCDLNPNQDIQTLKQSTELPDCVWDSAAEVVANIRQRILNETQLSASAGIACNTMIAKVCSDVNKPNGQHMIRGNVGEIEQFLESTPVRKICGIGPVRAQYLTALDIKTCKDLWHKRDIIRFCFTQFNADYYLRVGLGVGSHEVTKDEEPQKSISCERTVGKISDFKAICDILNELSEELISDLNKRNQSCKTLTLKLKKITFEVSLKSQTLPYYTSDSETIFNLSKKLLVTELSNTAINDRKYRLIGLKISNLKEKETERKVSSQLTLSQIFNALKSDSNKEDTNTSDYMSLESESIAAKDDNESNESIVHSMYDSDLYECSVCLQTFQFKNIFESHENDCIQQMLSKCTSDECEVSSDPISDISETTSAQTNDSNDLGTDSYGAECSESSGYLCPICSTLLMVDNSELNRHLDMCLNKDKCQELTQVPITSIASNSTPNTKSQKRVNSETKGNSDKKSQKCNNSKKQRKQTTIKSQKTIDSFFVSK